jgi:hypothetical protein
MEDNKFQQLIDKYKNVEVEVNPIDDPNYRSQFLVDPFKVIEQPPIAWAVKNLKQDKEVSICNLGDFCTISGRAKVKKSFFVNIAIAAALSDEYICNRFRFFLPENKKKVLYFDTEQNEYHVQLALKRILKQIKPEKIKNLETYHLRRFSVAERVKFIENVIYSRDDVGFVVIDGAVDLCEDFMGQKESMATTELFLRWTADRNFALATVIHQNKQSTTSRGHLGAFLEQKGQTTLDIVKDTQNTCISTVSNMHSREKEMEPFSFEINGESIPIAAEGYEPKIEETKIKFTDLTDEQLKTILDDVFKNNSSYRYAELWHKIIEVYPKEFGELKQGPAKSAPKYLCEKRLLTKIGTTNATTKYLRL